MMNKQLATAAQMTQLPLVVRFPWVRVSFFLLTCGVLLIAYSMISHKNKMIKLAEQDLAAKQAQAELLAEEEAAKKQAIAQQDARARESNLATASPELSDQALRTSKGLMLENKLTLSQGGTAREARLNDASYVVKRELFISLPQSARSLEELTKLNPQLTEVLPDLAKMLESATVSPYFKELYDRKAERIESNAADLDDLLTRHNLYDCEAILELKHPETGRRALIVQAEMDVVSDGSDGDRLPTMPKEITTSSYYQPMTSYGWKKTGDTPNPLIAGWKGRIAKANAEISLAKTKADRSNWLKGRIVKIEREIADMESRSFLIADYDPFIVMPVAMVTADKSKNLARIGDYGVVIYNDKIYPTIVGDAGPSHKVGEASLRMSKELNESASSYKRPVSELTVTYLVFPGSADPFQEPDYKKWHQKCAKLLGEIGGIGEGIELHEWENTFPIPEPEPELELELESESDLEVGTGAGSGDKPDSNGNSIARPSSRLSSRSSIVPASGTTIELPSSITPLR